MGYIRHDLTIFSVIDFPEGAAAMVEAKVAELRASVRPEMARLIVGPIESAINGDIWYAMLPDGSKEGWSTSYEGEEVRSRFAALAPYPVNGMRWGDEEATAWEGDYMPMEDPGESPLDFHGAPWNPFASEVKPG